MKYDDEISFEEAIAGHASSEERFEHSLPRGAFLLAFVFASAMIGVFLIRFGVLGIIYGDFYASRASANADKESVIPAYRGAITDRFGNELVRNVPSFKASVDASELYRGGNAASAEETLAKIARILGADPEVLRRTVREADLETTVKVSVAQNLSQEQVIDLKALGSSAVLLEDDYRREYADPFVFSHIVGYAKDSDVRGSLKGKVGLEAQYDILLRGQDGLRISYRDAKGNVLQEKKAREARAGAPLTTTIDGEFQRYFHTRFKEGLDSLGKTAGVGMAMDPKTGEILALISLPSFDNNDPAAYLGGAGKPLFNRAISGVYSPGSTIKPLVALAALHEGLITPDFTVYSPGYLELPNPYDAKKPNRFLDWQKQGLVNLYSALARSSNVFFYVIGGGCTQSACKGYGVSKGLGITKLKGYWQKFMLDKKTGVDIPSEAVGFLPDSTEKEKRTGTPWRIGDTYNVSIGQGDLGVTPLRLISFFASIANGGVLMRPHFSLHAQQEVLQDYSSWKDELVAVRQGLRDVVAKPYGTASALYALPYKTSGKTGSAQTHNNTKTNAFFVGYGPTDDPKIVVLIIVEDAKTGSMNAVPIGRDVLDWYYTNRL